MINLDICEMRSGVIKTNTLKYTKPPTDATGLYSFMDLAVLVLRGHLVAFPYRKDAQTGKVKEVKLFCRKILLDID